MKSIRTMPREFKRLAVGALSALLGFAVTAESPHAGGPVEADSLVPLVISVSEKGKEAPGGTVYELYSNDDDGFDRREKRWKAFAKAKLGRFHVMGSAGAEIGYSEAVSPSLTEHSSWDPKLINYWVKESELGAAMKFLWEFPEVIKVVVDNITELQQSSHGRKRQERGIKAGGFPRVYKLRVDDADLGRKSALRIAGVKGLCWKPDNGRYYYILCESKEALDSVKRIETLFTHDKDGRRQPHVSPADRSEFTRLGLMTQERARYFFRSTAELLANIPNSVPVIELAPSQITVFATDDEYDGILKRLR